MRHQPISEIAREITADWRKPHYSAVPYIEAMYSIDQIGDMYMMDTAKGIVLRFLGNAGTWRGATAKVVKAKLRKIAGVK